MTTTTEAIPAPRASSILDPASAPLPIFTLGMLAFLVNGDSRAVAPLLVDVAADFGLRLD